MASSRKSGAPGILGVLGLILAVCVIAVILVESGTAVNVASFFDTKPLTASGSLKASEKDQQSLNWDAQLRANPNWHDRVASGGLTLRANPNTDTGLFHGATLTPNPNANTGADATANGDTTITLTPQDQQPLPTGLPESAASPINTQQALNLVTTTIKTATPHTAGYDRETEFGVWKNSPTMCGTATTRDTILQRDLTGTKQNSSCKITSGSFNDPYTGKHMNFKYGRTTSQEIQIDHVVATYDAWASGLWKASQKTRETYYNDPEVLVASNGKANQEKSEGVNLKHKGKESTAWKTATPSVWLPTNKPYQCTYMAKRVYVKAKYSLTMSPWEKTETQKFLESCPTA